MSNSWNNDMDSSCEDLISFTIAKLHVYIICVAVATVNAIYHAYTWKGHSHIICSHLSKGS